jgi:Na+/proline symporter
VAAVVTAAGEAGRLSLVDWGPSPGEPGFLRRVLTDPNVVWLAVLGGFVSSLAAFGTDHDFMQRLLTVGSRRRSRQTLALTPLATLLTLAIYLGLGAALYTFYAQNPSLPVSRPEEILPHYVQQMLPAVLRGLVLSALVLASIDSPLGSLAASFVTDVYRPLLVKGRSERHYLVVARASVVLFGVLLGAIAYAFAFFDAIVWLALKIAGVTLGSLLGVFLLGLLSRRPVSDPAAAVAMLAMALVNLALLRVSETTWWLVLLGAAGTVALALGIGRLRDASAAPPLRRADTSGSHTP